jgi:hypothetical protein
MAKEEILLGGTTFDFVVFSSRIAPDGISKPTLRRFPLHQKAQAKAFRDGVRIGIDLARKEIERGNH